MIGRTLNTVLKNLFEGGVPVIVVLLVMLGSFRAGLIRAMAIPRDDLIAEMSERLNSKVPGVAFGFTQPIEMRVDELVAGVKADVAVLIYGDDLETLARLSKDLERTLRSIPGAADVKADYQANLTTVTIVPDRAALARRWRAMALKHSR